MGSWKIETRIASETEMGAQFSVINADSRLFRAIYLHPRQRRNVLEGQPQRLLHLTRGKVLCRVITATFIGISIALTLLFQHYRRLTRNGCVPIMLKRFW
jgi:hypothetical protein